MLIRMDRIYREIDNGDIYISLQHESNPLDLPNEISTLNKLDEIHNIISQYEDLRYYNIYSQPLDIDAGEGGYFDFSTGQLTRMPERVRCVQISVNCQEEFGLNAHEGRLLTEYDYQFSDGVIPVLMGASYESIYSLGYTFEAEYLFNSFVFEVVGFLESNSKIERSTGTIPLDSYIIMPMFEYSSSSLTDKEFVTYKIHYANRASGCVCVSPGNYEEVLKFILSVLNNSEVGDFSWSSSSIIKNYERIGINIFSLFGTLLSVFFISEFVVLYIQFRKIHKSFCSNNRNQTFLISSICIILLSLLISVVISAKCLEFMGIAKVNTWGMCAAFITLIIQLTYYFLQPRLLYTRKKSKK